MYMSRNKDVMSSYTRVPVITSKSGRHPKKTVIHNIYFIQEDYVCAWYGSIYLLVVATFAKTSSWENVLLMGNDGPDRTPRGITVCNSKLREKLVSRPNLHCTRDQIPRIYVRTLRIHWQFRRPWHRSKFGLFQGLWSCCDYIV